MKRQRIDEVTCVYCAYCNFYGLQIRESEFREDFIAYWRQLPSVVGRNPRVVAQRLSGLIGAAGYTSDVLKLQLKRLGKTFRELYEMDANFNPSLCALRNAFVVIRVDASYHHMVCIKDGYVMDSLHGQPYLWHCVAEGYRHYAFVSFIELIGE